jgi:uncharacterized protein YbjT (DUF2867 family)
MKALVIGATGATGKDLVQVLLNDNDYSGVTIFVRRPGGIVHPKLKEVLTDFDQLENVAPEINGDICFSCFGTTLKIAGSKEKQWFIDHEIPYRFARMAKKNGINKMVLLSAYGANAASKVFYSKMKGKLEDDIDSLGFEQYIIFRPGLLDRPGTDRIGERIMLPVLKFMNRLGVAKKFRPLATSLLAEKLAVAPKRFPVGKHVAELDRIFGL